MGVALVVESWLNVNVLCPFMYWTLRVIFLHDNPKECKTLFNKKKNYLLLSWLVINTLNPTPLKTLLFTPTLLLVLNVCPLNIPNKFRLRMSLFHRKGSSVLYKHIEKKYLSDPPEYIITYLDTSQFLYLPTGLSAHYFPSIADFFPYYYLPLLIFGNDLGNLISKFIFRRWLTNPKSKPLKPCRHCKKVCLCARSSLPVFGDDELIFVSLPL